MIESAVVLLAKHGYRATSFDAVIEASGAPRGSIYHHFPGGKDELIAAAIDLAGTRAIAVLDRLEGSSPAAVVDGFMAMWRTVLDRSDFTAGCSVLAVTVSAETPELRERAGEIFKAWRGRLAHLLTAGGMADAVRAIVRDHLRCGVRGGRGAEPRRAQLRTVRRGGSSAPSVC